MTGALRQRAHRQRAHRQRAPRQWAPRQWAHRRQALPLPRWLLPLAVLGGLFGVIPIVALVARIDVTRLGELLGQQSSVDALWLSLRTTSMSTALCLLFGVPLGLALARSRFPGQAIVRALVLVPLVLPPVIGGIALLYAFGRRGLIGQALDLAGIQVPFTTVAVIMAQVFVSMPFVVLGVEGASRSSGDRFAAVAAGLGASPTRVLLRVTLPLLRPALVSSAVMAFSRGLGEFGATLAFAGSLQGVTRTLPLQIYLTRESDAQAAVALAVVLIVIALAGVSLAYRPPPRRSEPVAWSRGLSGPSTDLSSEAGR